MPENARDIFAENLTRLLEGSGRSQADLIRDLGLRQSTVSDWMGGKKYPRVDKIQLLADYFGVSRARLTERRQPGTQPGSAQWLREGLAARGLKNASGLSERQLESILESMELMARAFCGE